MMYRQGDVLIVAVKAIPSKLRAIPRNGRIVLAEGEATGHAHVITDEEAALYGTDLAERYLSVLAEGGVLLTHEEHDAILIPLGTYQVIRQREYAPEGERQVAD